jgi:hypothetical protein
MAVLSAAGLLPCGWRHWGSLGEGEDRLRAGGGGRVGRLGGGWFLVALFCHPQVR